MIVGSILETHYLNLNYCLLMKKARNFLVCPLMVYQRKFSGNTFALNISMIMTLSMKIYCFSYLYLPFYLTLLICSIPRTLSLTVCLIDCLFHLLSFHSHFKKIKQSLIKVYLLYYSVLTLYDKKLAFAFCFFIVLLTIMMVVLSKSCFIEKQTMFHFYLHSSFQALFNKNATILAFWQLYDWTICSQLIYYSKLLFEDFP